MRLTPAIGRVTEAGKPWAGGKSVRKRKTHRRTRSGREVPIPPGAEEADDEPANEQTGLLKGQKDGADVESARAATGTGGGV